MRNLRQYEILKPGGVMRYFEWRGHSFKSRNPFFFWGGDFFLQFYLGKCILLFHTMSSYHNYSCERIGSLDNDTYIITTL